MQMVHTRQILHNEASNNSLNKFTSLVLVALVKNLLEKPPKFISIIANTTKISANIGTPKTSYKQCLMTFEHQGY